MSRRQLSQQELDEIERDCTRYPICRYATPDEVRDLIDTIHEASQRLAQVREAIRNGRPGTAIAIISGSTTEIGGSSKEPLRPRRWSKHTCAACGKQTRNTTAGCDHCDLEDK